MSKLDDIFKVGFGLLGEHIKAETEPLCAVVKAFFPGDVKPVHRGPETPTAGPVVTLPPAGTWMHPAEIRACHPILNEYSALGENSEAIAQLLGTWGVAAVCEERKP